MGDHDTWAFKSLYQHDVVRVLYWPMILFNYYDIIKNKRLYSFKPCTVMEGKVFIFIVVAVVVPTAVFSKETSGESKY